ncbi:hypothetical protein BY996DRAFT_8687045, partial [Phakopsora pachyrhizi]
MGKTDRWFRYFLQLTRMLIGISISVECRLLLPLDQSKLPVQDNRVNNRVLTNAHLESLKAQAALEPKVSLKPNGAVTKALIDTIDMRNDLKVAYQDIQNNFNFLRSNKGSFTPQIFKNIEITLEYISILTKFRLQEIVANEAKYGSVQIETIGDLEKLKESDISIEVIKKMTLTKLKDLTTFGTFKIYTKIFYSRLILSMVEYLLQQKFITFQESSTIFRNRNALGLLENKIENELYRTRDFFSVVLHADFFDSLVKHPTMRVITLILQNLEARERKYLIASLLGCFSDFYNYKKIIQDSQMQVLDESYRSLTKENYNVEDWLKMHTNFSFININQDSTKNYFCNLFIFHFLETHVKFNPEKLSKEAFQVAFLYRKKFKD